jgi:tetratricopeptide (TPR) repeat protein
MVDGGHQAGLGFRDFMSVPDWQSFEFEAGILPEPISDGNRIVLWLPRDRDASFQYWERVGNVARAEMPAEQGLVATAATSIRARQRLRGRVGELLRRLVQSKERRDFLLPNGVSSEQCGDRRTDLLLVWTDDTGGLLDESRVKSRCPEGTGFEKLGPNLYLVSGVTAPPAPVVPRSQPEPSAASPRERAEQLLAAARRAGDRRNEATALADVGVVLLSEGDARGAIGALGSALAIARELRDGARESDIVGNLGMATLAAGQPADARNLFEQELAHARATSDRFSEKVALERLGLAAASLRDFPGALSRFEQALALARQLGDRQQQANLLWYQGIQYAELGQRELAIAKAEESVALQKALGKPQAAWYGSLLQKYRMGLVAELPGDTSRQTGVGFSPESYLGGSIVASVMTSQSPAVTTGAGGPSLLRMALSATKAMATFLGSGLKTATPETTQRRLQTCAVCEHHTGMRCKICGCFTDIKSRMLHETCPIGKWPQ